jgi:hypothetical protein
MLDNGCPVDVISHILVSYSISDCLWLDGLVET